MYAVSDRFLETVSGTHQAVVRALLVNGRQFGAAPTGTELTILSGDVKYTATTDVKATLDITVPGDFLNIVMPFAGEIWVARGVAFGDGTSELVPMGYFRIDSISQDPHPYGPVQILASDRISAIQQNRVLFPYQVPDGTTHRTIFERLINGRTTPVSDINTAGYAALATVAVPITWTAYDPDRATVSGGQVVEDSTYDFLAKLADGRDAVLRFDENGELFVEPRDRDPDAPAVYDILPGNGGNLVRASLKVDRDGTYNIVSAYGSDPAAPTGYRLAYNADPTSPLRWNGPFGPAPRYYASPLLRTAEAARDAAATILSRYTGLPTTFGLWTVPNPALRPLDTISAKVTGLAEKHLVDEVTIPLSIAGAGPVEITTKTTNQVIIPESDDSPPTTGGDAPTALQILQEKCFQLTSTAENSTKDWWTEFGYLEDVGDTRGYTGGIAGFTSATGDMLEVVQQYAAAKPTGNVLAPFIPGLQTCASTGMGGSASSTADAQLGNPFKAAWATAATDPVWQTAQQDYRNQVYWTLAYNAAVADGVGALGQALYYDTSINHGPGEAGSGDGSFDDIRYQVQTGSGSSTNLGSTASSGSSSASSADKTAVSTFTAAAGGTVTTGVTRCSMSSGSTTARMVVYANSSGVPGALLAQSDAKVISNTTVSGQTFTFSGANQITIVNGTVYWVGLSWQDPGSPSLNLFRGGTGSARQEASAFLPNPFGTPTAQSGPVDAYVVVTASGGAPSAGGNETTWLTNWLTKRGLVLTAWGDNPVDGRIAMFTTLLGTANLTLTCPFSWSVYGDSYTMSADPFPYGWTGSGTGGTGGQTNWPNPGSAHNIGSIAGQNSFNVGVGFNGSQPEQFSSYGSSHHDFGRDEIEAGLVIPGFYELNAAGEVLMTSHPDGGKTSSNTSYSRVEYRELERDGKTKMAFNPSNGTHYVQGRSAADALSAAKPQMVLAQMHDSSDDTVMIYVNDQTHVICKVRGTTVATLDSSYTLGTLKDWKIELVDGTLNIYWDDLDTPAYTNSTAFSSTSAGQYFKTGSYMQWNTSNGDGTLGKVRLVNLEHWHSKTPLSSSPWPTPARPATGGSSTGAGGGTGTGSTGGTSSQNDGVETAKLLGWGSVIDGDEFDYVGAPNSRWGMYDGEGHGGNGVRSPSAFNVANGILTCTGDNVNGGTTGGMQFSRSSKLWRVEWRVRLYSLNPSGGGHRYHAVLILWPTSDLWPQGGEDDFFECNAEDGAFTAYIHIPGNDGSAQHAFEKIKQMDLSQWHNIAYERSSPAVTCWVDGVQVFKITDSDIRVPGPLSPTFQLDNFYGSGMEPAKFEAQFFRIYNPPS